MQERRSPLFTFSGKKDLTSIIRRHWGICPFYQRLTIRDLNSHMDGVEQAKLTKLNLGALCTYISLLYCDIKSLQPIPGETH